MNATSVASIMAGVLLLTSLTTYGPAPGETPPAAQKVTLDGVIHADSDDTPAFTPTEDTVFFDRSEGTHKTIMMSRLGDGKWATPQVASFSGRWFDQDPVIAPDGSYLLFNSDRPVTPGGQPLRQNYFKGGPGPGSNIWRVDRKGAGWSKPKWLGPIINNDVFVDFASIARDGSLYFIRWDDQAKAMHIWKSIYRGGRYLAPEFVQLGDPSVSTHDPAVAPDQSFIVFDYGKVKGGLGRLCVAFREATGWSEPVDLGDEINSDIPWGAHVGPNGREIYYTGNSGIWQIPARSLLQKKTE